MRDFHKLRAVLLLALAGCPGRGGDGTTTTGNGNGNELGNETTDPTPTVQRTEWPTSAGDCDSGNWCGPVTQAAEAASTPPDDGCPQNFYRGEMSFSQDTSAGGTNECCYYWYNNGGCVIEGRPLVEGGAARVAPVRDGGAWSKGALPPPPAMPSALREALARGWLDDALVEHASVASFARAALELMALGAPPELLADCQRAGLDEVRHAEACFALAERYGRRRLSPGPIAAVPAREATLERLAVDTFLEGCVAETIATLAATRALAACTDEVVARHLRRIVRDETRHASLAWRTIAWAIAEGGEPVKQALRAAAQPPRDLPPAPGEPALLAHGRLDPATTRAAILDAWREIITPTLAGLVA